MPAGRTNIWWHRKTQKEGANDGMDIPTGELRELSLFSGYGGYSLALRLAGFNIRTVCYVEHDRYAQLVLQQRFKDEPPTLDPAPIWDDINSFDPEPWRGYVDIVSAGFPCQPHSQAGARRIAKGLHDDRDLWPQTRECLRVVRPRYAVLENVPGILFSGNGGRQPYGVQVLGELSALGFSQIEWGIYSASDAGASHLRRRWFVLAHADADPQEREGVIEGMGGTT